MDLDKIGLFRDASLSNLEWLADEAATFDASTMKKPNNIKPDLDIQWGGMGDVGVIGENEVKRNLPPTMSGVEPVIRFCRACMLRGEMGAELGKHLRASFPKEDLVAALPKLKELLAFEGLIGTVVVDANGYKSCREALAASEKSPFSRHLSCVMNCKCGQHLVPSRETGFLAGEAADSTGNFADDFFADKTANQPFETPVCQSTMKPIIAGAAEIDETMKNKALTELMNTGKLTESEAEVIDKQDAKPWEKTAAAFKLASLKMRKEKNAQYLGKVDNSAFRLTPSNTEVIAQERRPMEPQAVNLTNSQTDVQVVASQKNAEIESPKGWNKFEGSEEIKLNEKTVKTAMEVEDRGEFQFDF